MPALETRARPGPACRGSKRVAYAHVHYLLVTAALSLLLVGCITSPTTPTNKSRTPPVPEAVIKSYQPQPPLELTPVEREATQAALHTLVRTLGRLAREPRFLLGHEDTTAYGVGWSEEPDRSDPKSVSGAHPAVYGWDLFRIERASKENGDGVNFDSMRRLIQEAHARGGINTVSWHTDNPVSGGDAWDKTRAVGAIIPGGSHHGLYKVYLDRVADFLASCRGPAGELIPMIFRPFHEHTGSWFWWGAAHASDEEYVALWRFTVDHLRNERRLVNLLFAFSPGGGEVKSEDDYLFRYPGDTYVDIMGVDHYYDRDVGSLLLAVTSAVRVAEKRGKVAALTEFGIRDGEFRRRPGSRRCGGLQAGVRRVPRESAR